MKELTTFAAKADDAKFVHLAAQLPDDVAGLIAAAKEAVDAYDGAVMAADTLAIEQASQRANDRYAAVIWKLNGNTFFGSRASDDAPAGIIERHCAAAPGVAPKWGQRGEFLLTVAGMRAVVVVGESMRNHASMAFHAIDVDRPFLSPTGYQSHFINPQPGKTIAEVAEAAMSHCIKKCRVPIEPEYRARLTPDRFAWIDNDLTASEVYEEAAGQMAFTF